MNTALKLGIAAAFIGVIALGLKKAIAIGNGFKVDVLRYGLPKISNGVVALPVQLHLQNPTSLTINLQHLIAEFSIYKSNGYQKVGQINQPISIPPGDSIQQITAMISLNDIFGGGNFFDFALSTLATKSFKLRTQVTPVWNGIPIKLSPFDQTVSLNGIAS